MKKRYWLLTLVFGLMTSAVAAVDSQYTSVNPKDCIAIEAADLEKEPQIDHYYGECPGFGGYRVFVSGGDLRYGIRLEFEGKRFTLMKQDTFYDLGSNKIEWRYERLPSPTHKYRWDLHYRSLIYRLMYSDPETDRERQALVVVKLDGKDTCVTGVVKQSDQMNEKAREMAEDTSRSCWPDEKLRNIAAVAS